jgi:hypothetical protein
MGAEKNLSHVLLSCDTMLPTSSRWRWRQHGPPKCWYPTKSLHGVTTQKAVTGIFITVKTSHLTYKVLENMKEKDH